MNTVVYVPAFFKAIGENVTKKVPTGETKKGFFGGEKELTKEVTEWVQTGYSDKWIDGDRLSKDISKAVSKLNNDGYEVISVTPITSGNYSYNYAYKGAYGSGSLIEGGGYGYGYGYGYSYTEGVTIIAKKSA